MIEVPSIIKMVTVIFVVIVVVGVFTFGRVKVMEKKLSEQNKIWIWPDRKRVPLLGESGPVGLRFDSAKPEEKLAGLYENGESRSEIAGSLSFFVVRDPKSFFEGVKDPDRYLNIDLTGDEWGALFYDELKCPKATIEPFSTGEDSEQWRERYRLKFQQSIPNYVMLSRIWDFYDYVSYRPEEIAELREECLKVKSNSTSEKALVALTKLIEACDEASKSAAGLLFVPD